MPTIRDVAEKAGVGLGTVSRVLNDSHLVSEPTRQRVLKAISDLNYMPSLTARRLSLGKTMTIAVIVPFFTRPSVTERLRGIENTLVTSDYDLTIYNVETVKRRDECMQHVIRRERADGVLIISLSPRDEDLSMLMDPEIPVVLVDANHTSLSGLNRVVEDDIAGGYKATRHLVELGHKRIGYISDYLDTPFNFTSSRDRFHISDYLDTPFNFTSSRDRFHGFRQALEKSGIVFCPEYQGQGPHGRQAAYENAARILALPEPPTAIFAASDTQAMGVLQAARDAGLDVPGELSIIGYDDLEIAEYLGLTTIRQLLYLSGQRGAELLIDAIQETPREPQCEVLPTELVVRNTTADCPEKLSSARPAYPKNNRVIPAKPENSR
jgi:DNA-binding LacI/PurR family transcriptional regulator